jgi:hypothetical protein
MTDLQSVAFPLGQGAVGKAVIVTLQVVLEFVPTFVFFPSAYRFRRTSSWRILYDRKLSRAALLFFPLPSHALWGSARWPPYNRGYGTGTREVHSS